MTQFTRIPEGSMNHIKDFSREYAESAAMDLLAALQVITRTPRILEFLASKDPKALQQAREAIAKATTPNEQ